MLVKRLQIFVILCTALLAFSAYSQASNNQVFTSSDCLSCHQEQTQKWQLSDHAKAMEKATSTSVLGNFDNKNAKHFDQLGFFFKEGEIFKARIKDSPNDKGETFDVKYTFGHYPLQQYLVETQRGKLHVLPFAWDSRTEQEGGQRWFHIYDHSVNANDRLHWRQPLQNWNGMCADCHSDELTRNYESISDTFATTFSGINVSCVSCHAAEASAWGNNHPKPGDAFKAYQAKTNETFSGHWALKDGEKTVSWLGEPRDNSFMDTCFACHSLRSPLTDGFKANTDFLNNFSPSLITPPLYYADGQIKEEVYVYGSFLQSKMFEKGVNCLDCHDPHTMKLKVEGNGLCLQCHTADNFDTPKHHKHPIGSEGAQCVNCHMTDQIYMGVDARRDHSFKIPRPDLSDAFDTPNACISCHSDQPNEWASQALLSWNGKPKALSTNRQNLLKLRHGQSISLQAHLLIAYDESIDVITRASVIEMLSRSSDQLLASNLSTFTNHSEGLIRLAAARVANLVPLDSRISLLSPLLKDAKRSVRKAAVEHLVNLDIAKTDITAYRAAFNELLTANKNVAWRGEGRLNLSNIWLQSDEPEKAKTVLEGAIELDPYFALAYVNLSDIYRAENKEALVGDILSRGIENVPESADVAYSYGLHKVRQKQLPAALELFAQSMKLDPVNPRLAYTYILALDGLGNTRKALNELKVLLPKYTGREQELIELGLYLAQKAQSRADFIWFQNRS